MSLQHEVFALPQVWSRHLSLLGAWSDSAFAASQEYLRLHYATWGQQAEPLSPEFPFLNWCNPHALFTLQEQWTIPNFEHFIDYQSACTQIFSEAGKRMAQAWAEHEVLQPTADALATPGETVRELHWQLPGLSFSQVSLLQTSEPANTLVPVSSDTADQEEQLSNAAELISAAPAPTELEQTETVEFNELDNQQALHVAAAAVAKARANSSEPDASTALTSHLPQAKQVASTPTSSKPAKTSRASSSTKTKPSSVAASTSGAIASKKKSSKAGI